MRLRLAPVEYKICPEAECDTEYEGAQCPQCKQPDNPAAVARRTYDRLILADIIPPPYEQAQRCRCPECKSLFELSDKAVIRHAQCASCGKSLFSPEDIQEILEQGKNTAAARETAAAGTPRCRHLSALLGAGRTGPMVSTHPMSVPICQMGRLATKYVIGVGPDVFRAWSHTKNYKAENR